MNDEQRINWEVAQRVMAATRAQRAEARRVAVRNTWIVLGCAVLFGFYFGFYFGFAAAVWGEP